VALSLGAAGPPVSTSAAAAPEEASSAATRARCCFGWQLATAGILLGFPCPLQEQAFQDWKREHLAELDGCALWAQALLVLLPACVLLLHGLLWMRGGRGVTVAAVTALWAAVGHVPAVMRMWLPAIYAQHHDAIWALSTLAGATIALALPACGLLPYFQLPGLLFRNMLAPAVIFYFVLPALLQLSPGWQLLASIAGYITMSVSIAIAAEGAFPMGPGGHVALVAASVAIACAMEWRNRAPALLQLGAAPAQQQ
jgi:hypothetical protein